MEIMRSKMQQVQMVKAVKNNLWITDPEEIEDPDEHLSVWYQNQITKTFDKLKRQAKGSK